MLPKTKRTSLSDGHFGVRMGSNNPVSIRPQAQYYQQHGIRSVGRNMKAMILAAGLGTRLGVITKDTPKPLIQVGGKPILEHVILKLKAAGVTSLVINLHYLAEKIEAFLKSKENFGLEIRFSYEKKILGTGGGVKNAAALLSGRQEFLLYNADTYSDISLTDLYAAHKNSAAVATPAIMARTMPSYLLFRKDLSLVGWSVSKDNKLELVDPAAEYVPYHFCGISIISTKIFELMKYRTYPFSIIESFIDAVRLGQKVIGYQADGSYWNDMGSSEGLAELEAHLKGKK